MMIKRPRLIFIWLWLVLVAVMIAFLVNLAQGAERDVSINVGIATGSQINDDPLWHRSKDYDWKLNYADVRFSKNISKRWRLGSGLRLSQLRYDRREESFVIDSTLRLIYEFLRLGPMTFYTEGGLGLAWINHTPSKNFLGDDFPAGVINYGVGVRFPVSKKLEGTITFEFLHFSELFCKDSGANNGLIRFGIGY